MTHVYLPKMSVLQSRRDIHIIACNRSAANPVAGLTTNRGSPRCVGVRWASRLDLGFPTGGYLIARRPAAGGAETQLGTFWLPASQSWAAFEADAIARQPACGGPYFETITEDDLGYLLPIIRLVDPRTPASESIALTTNVADFFREPHTGSARLKWEFWPTGSAPSLAALLADPASSGALVEYYRYAALQFVHVLALRFEYAALFGLGCDDSGAVNDVVYVVRAAWHTQTVGESESQVVHASTSCAPPAPAWLTCTREPGSVPHPAFAAWPAWEPPPALAPLGSDGLPLPGRTLVPRCPAAFSGLTWAAAPHEPNLIGYGPVLYRVGRYDHGAATAGQTTIPPLPSGAVFNPVNQGEDLVRRDPPPHFIDLPGMPWPELEGHYHYEIRSVDLLGATSLTATRASIRHFDDIAPPAPRVVGGGDPVCTVPIGGTSIGIDLGIVWDAAEDFVGPDTTEFRVSAQWTPSSVIHVHIVSVQDVDVLHADVILSSLPGSADQYVAAIVSLPGGDFPIVSNATGANATMRVRKIGTRMPSAGTDGVIFSAGTPTSLQRIAKLARRQAIAAHVAAVPSLVPVEIELVAEGSAVFPTDATVRIYLHLLRTSFDATLIGTQRWRIDQPAVGTPGRTVWDAWLALADPAAAMHAAPVIVFPPHSTTVTVTKPSGFVAGLLSLFVTAADDASYIDSPVLPVVTSGLAGARGNESARTETVRSVRTLDPPEPPETPAYDPLQRMWATSAAVYAEQAEYSLGWTAVSGAVRYEVWRALEGALPNLTPLSTDDELRTAGASTAGAEAFELRADQVFSAGYTDRMPGRAPTRALYRIRAIGQNGTVSAPSAIIGPIYVPDVRRPVAPNLCRVAAVQPTEADRTIAVEWTQSGPLDDVRFDVFFRAASASSDVPALAGSLPAGTAPGAGGTFRFLHGGRAPGKKYSYVVYAVREALDPIDPAASTRRDITSSASNEHTGSAISSVPLAAPESLAASIVAGQLQLTWLNRDTYESIEVWSRLTEHRAYTKVASVLPDAELYTSPLPAAGEWNYQLRGIGVSRQTRSQIDATLVVP